MPYQEKKRALIVVRTYPVPAKQGIEVSCTAAITDKGEWLRIFPVPWRRLEKNQRFRKYQWTEITVIKASDHRPESYKLLPDGISIVSGPLSTANGWQARKDVVFPLRACCLCCLIAQRDERGHPTLGVFKPKSIRRLVITPERNPTWTDGELALLRQGDLFVNGPKNELEKIPFKFSYEFKCPHDSCNGHKLMSTDWEMGESYRKWKNEYGHRWEDKFRQRYEKDMILKYDMHFYVGTVHRHPGTWIIVGLFYPPDDPQGTLFD